MFNTADEAIDWVTARRNCGNGLEAFKKVMKQAGNPQDSFSSVHVAGTNGKGSTSSMLAAILQTKYPKVGLFTSPHLINHRDRIRLNGEWISETEFTDLVNQLKPLIEENRLSMFEIDMLVASLWYQQKGADIVVYETGLGGRLDFTNVLRHPELCIITTIDYDHMDRLGNTIEEIAYEKAGIITEESNVLIGNLREEAKTVITQRALQQNARLYQVDALISSGRQELIYHGDSYRIHSLAEYQKYNAALALQAAELLGINIHDERVRKTLETADWAGRFEIVKEHPLVILDGAHNEEGIRALTQNFQKLPRPVITVFSALADKRYRQMEDWIEAYSDRVIITDIHNKRAQKAELLSGSSSIYCADLEEALKMAESMATETGTVVVTGSLYLISMVHEKMKLISEKM